MSSEPAVSLPSFGEGAAGEETEPNQIIDEELAEPSHAAGSETVELGQGAVGNVVELDHHDKLLFCLSHCAARYQHRGAETNDDVGRSGHRKGSRYCEIAVNQIHPKRSKSLRRPSLSLLDIRSQMETVLATHLFLLINVHRRLHESYFDSGTRSEATDFPMFKNNVESPEEFSRHTMSLQLTIATDGFVPAPAKQYLFRQELWPLHVRVDDLPSKIGNNYLNIIMAGVLWTSKTPHEELWEGLWTHLATELTLVNSNEPLQILGNVTGNLWTIRLRLTHAVVDYKGLQDIFGIPRWLSRYGCHKCLFPGISVGRKLNWYCSEPLRFTKRTSANILDDAELGRNGLMRKTSAMDLFTPAQCCADALHVISEGVTQDRLRDLLFRSSKFDEMKLGAEIVGELNRVLMNITNYTYSSRFILCNEDLPSMTGAEIDAFANVVFPLVGALALCPSALSSASIVGYWFCVKELQAVEDLTAVKIRVIQSVALHVKQIWSRLSQEIFTIKTHNFFDHCILDEIEQHGSPYLWSAAPFEAIHRVLQIPHNQYVTNSDARVLTRFVTIKKLVRLMEEAVERNHSENFAKLLRDMRNEEKRSLTHMAPKRKFRYEDTGVKKAGKASRARLLANRENVRVIAQLRDRRPGEQSTSDFDEDTTVGDEEEPLSLSDRVLYYAALVEHSGMSKEAVRRMEKLMGVIYGKPPPFTERHPLIRVRCRTRTAILAHCITSQLLEAKKTESAKVITRPNEVFNTTRQNPGNRHLFSSCTLLSGFRS
ncbi:unnamed protein product [Cylicocyclus nassatus]|uniref:Uncharacterized protein n=1 Tax=Cylicocyclus nassatus TaxID=53992 RepID=A0AA36GS28_CYLNA|nr:unnamed protein product [Cylicocyclus nassatus]